MAGSFGKRGVTAARPRAFAPAPAAPSGFFAQAEPSPPPRVVPRAEAVPSFGFPLVTILLIFIITAVFAFEVKSAPSLYPGMQPPLSSLVAYGAIDGHLVFDLGQWWRVFTAPLLHANLDHLIGNAIVFAIIGVMLEPKIGSRWFAGLFTVGGIGGALASVILNEPGIPGVGASGAIMGVLGAAFICGASARTGDKGKRMQKWALWLILPSLIPAAADSHVDFAAHLGGVLSGIVMGVVLQMSWQRGEDKPDFGNVGAGIAAFGALCATLAFLFGTSPGNAKVAGTPLPPAGIIPEDEVPQVLEVSSDKARDLLARYPKDPRAHLFRGFAFLRDDHDLADAEEQFRQALASGEAAHLPPAFAETVSVLLALTVAYENRPDEALALGSPHCAFAQENLSGVYEMLQNKNICPAD